MLPLLPQETIVNSDHPMLLSTISAWGGRLGGEQLLPGPLCLTECCLSSFTSLVSDIAVMLI